MLSDEDDGASVRSTAKPPALRKKRKIVLDESDEEGGQIDAVAYKEGLSARKRSPGRTAKGPQKKPRVSPMLSGEITDPNNDNVDEDEDESSHRSRSRASSLSEAESDVPERPKATKKTAKHPYLTKDQASGGSNTFLTAAERRVQDKKAEKKSSEDPFYFLQDVRDKDGAWKEFTPFEKQLATHTLALSFFATHYGSLTDDFAYHPNIRNMHMETMVDDEKRELVFLYKLIGGAASSSFGTHVASLAGVPSDIVERADIVSNDFARNFKEKTAKKKDKVSGRLPLVAQADFAYLYGLATGKDELPENKARRKAILSTIKGAVRNYLIAEPSAL
ncbi:hypothetical protein IEO21_08858 [Rhodonia placenta]|uniref:DNA mismatch repair proteins mutS family domain-containing protein n=1 Tax=Rhodonia placenta TaxID=104341 RepID=A0A8H7TYB3_9APHY|nr:hypothetical protein IEO21_08858 [Postia placenta]